MVTQDDCIFCKIVKRELPSRWLDESQNALAILDIAQVVLEDGEFVPGRSLVIPKKHVPHFYDLDDEETAELFILAKSISAKLKAAFSPEFITMFIRGRQVPHAHIILQPSNKDDPVDNMFINIREHFKQAPDDMLDDMSRQIRGV
jgi:histidine triad (HIT) family protein